MLVPLRGQKLPLQLKSSAIDHRSIVCAARFVTKVCRQAYALQTFDVVVLLTY
jgi:hypothetical protein